MTTLNTIKESNEAVARIAVEQLYDNACIAAGTLDDPRVLMARLNKVLEMFIYQGAGFDYSRNEYITQPAANNDAALAAEESITGQDEQKAEGDSKATDTSSSGSADENKPKFEESNPNFEESKPKFEESKPST